MFMTSLKNWVRLGVAVLGAYSMVGQQTPYWINLNTFLCDPTFGKQPGFWCRDLERVYTGVVAADAGAQCNQQTGRNDGSVFAGAVAGVTNCNNPQTIIADGYATPGNEPFYYAVSAGGYSSACSPNAYKQDACDVQYNYQAGGCSATSC